MPRIAYRTPGATSSAMTPVPAHDGRGNGPWSNSAQTAGQPGTLGIDAGLPEFHGGLVVNGGQVRGGGGGYAQGSSTMRNQLWFPSLYWQRHLAGFTLNVPGQGPSIYSDNQMPVPAAVPAGRAAVMFRPPVFLGQQQLEQPAGSKGHGWKTYVPRWWPHGAR